MNEEKTKDTMQAIGRALDDILNPDKDAKKTGFCILLFGFNAPGISNYLSNAKREDMILSLKETVKRLEAGEDNVRFGDEVLDDA